MARNSVIRTRGSTRGGASSRGLTARGERSSSRARRVTRVGRGNPGSVNKGRQGGSRGVSTQESSSLRGGRGTSTTRSRFSRWRGRGRASSRGIGQIGRGGSCGVSQIKRGASSRVSRGSVATNTLDRFVVRVQVPVVSCSRQDNADNDDDDNDLMVVSDSDDKDDDDLMLVTQNLEVESKLKGLCAKHFPSGTVAQGLDCRAVHRGWVFPSSFPIPSYLLDATEMSLLNNTLVNFPRKGGNRILAGLVLYNMAKWFPSNVIIFIASSRNSMESYYDSVSLLMGAKVFSTVATKLLFSSTVYTSTFPVVFTTLKIAIKMLLNDAAKIRCIVFEECFDDGNQLLVESIITTNSQFRIVALTYKNVSEKVSLLYPKFEQLCISHIVLTDFVRSQGKLFNDYLRTEEMGTGEISESSAEIKLTKALKAELDVLYKGFHRLKLTKFTCSFHTIEELVAGWNELKKRQQTTDHLTENNYETLCRRFEIAIILTKARGYLEKHGTSYMCSYLQEFQKQVRNPLSIGFELYKIVATQVIKAIDEIKIQTGLEIKSIAESPFANVTQRELIGSYSNLDSILGNHPKLRLVYNILAKHFKSIGGNIEKVLVISQSGYHLHEIMNLLSLLPKCFSIRSSHYLSGINIGREFRNGMYNVLVAKVDWILEKDIGYLGSAALTILFEPAQDATIKRKLRRHSLHTITLLHTSAEYILHRHVSESENADLLDFSKLKPYLWPSSPRLIPSYLKLVRATIDVTYNNGDVDSNSEMVRLDNLVKTTLGHVKDHLQFTTPALSIHQLIQEQATHKTFNGSTCIRLVVGVVQAEVDCRAAQNMWERKMPNLKLIDDTSLQNNDSHILAILHPGLARKYGYLLTAGATIVLSNVVQSSIGVLMVVPNSLVFIGSSVSPERAGIDDTLKIVVSAPDFCLLQLRDSPHVKTKPKNIIMKEGNKTIKDDDEFDDEGDQILRLCTY